MDTTTQVIDDRFEVERELDPGALVVRDRSRPSGPRRLLRLVSPSPEDPSGRSLAEELRRLRGFSHPGFATVHEVGRLLDGRLFFLQDLLEGENFFAWAGGRDPLELARVFAQLLELLAAIHSRGLVIGGLRPMRLIVETPHGKRPRLRLVDPGGVVEEFARVDPVHENANLLAPERRVGARVDRRANLWEAGVVLYELLAGSSHAGMPLRPLQPAGFPPLAEVAPTLPLPLAAFVMVLLRPVPDDRPPSAMSALAELQRASGLDLGAPAGPGADAPYPTACVGRQHELLGLLAWSRPLTDRDDRDSTPARSDPTLVVLRGPAGSGRQRLQDELAVRLEADEVRVLQARCGGGNGILGGLAALLRQILARDGKRRLASSSGLTRWLLAEILPDAVQGLPPGSRPEPLEHPADERLRVLDALANVVLEAARARPTLLCLRHLEAAHPLERELIGHLARRARVARSWAGSCEKEGLPEPALLLLATAEPRSGEGSLAELLDQPYARAIDLGPLAERDLVRLGASHLGQEPDHLPDELRALLREQSAGLPGAALVALAGEPGDRDPVSAAERALNRIDGPEDEALVTFLALLRRPVELGELERLSALSRAVVTGRLEGLRRAGVVTARNRWRYELATPDMIEQWRQRLGPEAWRDAAGRLAWALDEAHASNESPLFPEELLELVRLAIVEADRSLAAPELLERHGSAAAAHLEATSSHREAARVYRALAKRVPGQAWQWRSHQAESLLRAGRYRKAARSCRRLLRSAEADTPTQRARVWHQRCLALWRSGAELEARQELAQALEELGDDLKGPAALERSRLLGLATEVHLAAGELEEASRRCQSGLDGLKLEGVEGPEAVRTRVSLLRQLGQLAVLEEDPTQAERLLKASLALQQRQGFAREAARTEQLLGNVAIGKGDFSRAEDHYRASLERWRGLDDARGEAQARSNLAMAAARRGALLEAREQLERSLRLREEAGDRQGTAASLHNLGYVYRCAGALPEAGRAYRRCLNLRRELEDRWYAAAALNNLGEVLSLSGEARRARQHLEEALAERESLGDRRGEAHTLAELAYLELGQGDFPQALTLAARSQKLREEVGDPEDQVLISRLRAEIHLALGDTARARRQAERAVDLVWEHKLAVHEAPARVLLGMVLARSGESDQARQELERARRAADSLGDGYTSRAAVIELSGLQLAMGDPALARARLDSRPVPRPGQLQPLAGQQPPDRHGVLRVRERLLRCRIELSRADGSVFTASRCAEEALEEARRAGLKELEWRANFALAAAAEVREKPDQALHTAIRVQEIVEELTQAVPADQRDTYLAADPVRAAALRGDSPREALKVQAGGGLSSDEEELLRLSRPGAVMIQPPRNPRAGVRAPPPPVQAPAASGADREALLRIAGLTRTIVDEPDVRRIYEALVTASLELLGGSQAMLAVFGEHADACTILAAAGQDDPERTQERFARRCAYKAAETGLLVVSADVKLPGERRRECKILGLGLRSLVAAPVRTPDGRQGALYVDHPFQAGVFAAREVELIETLADHCAMALSRAALEGALFENKGLRPGPAQLQLLKAKASVERPTGLRRMVRFGDEAWGLAGRSSATEAAVEALEQFAAAELSLLIEGPSGVGKGVVARAAHEASGRGGPLVLIDLRELQEGLIEQELFGHVADAFPGAGEARPGLLRSADGGTLLLERLDEAPGAVQSKLLRALQDRTVRPLGSDLSLPFDARVVATARDADTAVRTGALRPELLDLVAEARIKLSPLDQRPEDKGPLIDAILTAWEGAKPAIPGPVRQALEQRPYPGNAREVHAVLRAAAARARGRPLKLEDLPPVRRRGDQPSLAEAVRDFETRFVEATLRAHGGDPAATAKALGITRRALSKKLGELGIDE